MLFQNKKQDDSFCGGMKLKTETENSQCFRKIDQNKFGLEVDIKRE